MFGLDFDSIPQLGKIIAIAERLGNAFAAIAANTDIMERWKHEGVLPAKVTVYDYEVTVLIENKRINSIDIEPEELAGVE